MLSGFINLYENQRHEEENNKVAREPHKEVEKTAEETKRRRGDEDRDEETIRTGYWCMEGEAESGEAA